MNLGARSDAAIGVIFDLAGRDKILDLGVRILVAFNSVGDFIMRKEEDIPFIFDESSYGELLADLQINGAKNSGNALFLEFERIVAGFKAFRHAQERLGVGFLGTSEVL